MDFPAVTVLGHVLESHRVTLKKAETDLTTMMVTTMRAGKYLPDFFL